MTTGQVSSQPISPQEAERILNESPFGSTSREMSPLKCFKGRLKSVTEGAKSDTVRSGISLLRAPFRFTEVQVDSGGALCGDPKCVGSTVPFPYSSAEIVFTIPSQIYGFLGDSIEAITGEEHPKIMSLLGHVVHLKWRKGHAMRRLVTATNTWEDYDGEAYDCLDIDGKKAAGVGNVAVASSPNGVAAIDIYDWLATLANGKDQAGFNMAALTDDRVKADIGAFSAVAKSSEAVLQALIAQNKLMKNEAGIYIKV